MPNLIIHYTANLDRDTDMAALCRVLADTLIAARDEEGKKVFPVGGTRVLAYPAPHYAVGDDGSVGRAHGGTGDYAFMYLNLRILRGRTEATKQRVGEAVLTAAKTHMAPVFALRHMGLTLQVDEGQEVFDGKHNNLQPLFLKP